MWKYAPQVISWKTSDNIQPRWGWRERGSSSLHSTRLTTSYIPTAQGEPVTTATELGQRRADPGAQVPCTRAAWDRGLWAAQDLSGSSSGAKGQSSLLSHQHFPAHPQGPLGGPPLGGGVSLKPTFPESVAPSGLPIV